MNIEKLEMILEEMGYCTDFEGLVKIMEIIETYNMRIEEIIKINEIKLERI